MSSPQEAETVMEYRVVSNDDDWAVRGFEQLESAEEERDRLDRRGEGEHRLQQRTVTKAPWEDVTDE